MNEQQQRRPVLRLLATAVSLFFTCLLVIRLIPLPDVPLQLSRETTYFTEPLREDGTVDYAAAINAQNRAGVTAGNNAVIPLLQALAFRDTGPEVRQKILVELGTELPLFADEGFIGLADYIFSSGAVAFPEELEEWEKDDFRKEQDHHWEQRLDEALETSTWEGDFAVVADWVGRNKSALSRLSEAAQCERFYWPLVPERDDLLLFDGNHVPLEGLLEVSRCMAVRARMSMTKGHPAGAWDDIQTLYQLSHLVAQADPLIIRLVAGAIRSLASHQASLLLQSDLDEGLTRRMAADLGSLPAWPTMERSIRFEIRYTALHAACWLNRSSLPSVAEQVPHWLARNRSLNLATMLPKINRWADRFEPLVRGPVSRTALQQWRDLDQEFAREIELTGGISAGDFIRALVVRNGMRQVTSEKVLGLVLSMILSSGRPLELELQGATEVDLVRIGIAMHQHRVAHGRYPDDLAELAPALLDTVPLDPFTDRPMIYRIDGDGYLLYSVGPDGGDDGGRPSSRAARGEPFDIVLRLRVVTR